MNLTMAIEEDSETMRERKCIVTGEVREEAQLIRFAVSPDGDVVPDIAAKLPGRGIWVSADRAILERAIAKNHFSKAAKANVKASAELPALVEKLIVQRMTGDLGMARRSDLDFDRPTGRALVHVIERPVGISRAFHPRPP